MFQASSNASIFEANRERPSNVFTQYSSHISVHGVQYLGDPKRPILERMFWILIFILTSCTCIILTWKTWYKWNNHPVIISFNNKISPISVIPFPAVTICPESKISRAKFNVTKFVTEEVNLGNTNSSTDNQLLNFIYNMCFENHFFVEKDLPEYINGSDYIEKLEKYGPELIVDSVIQSRWNNKNVKFFEIFRKILTDDGICYTFNALHPKDIYRKESFPPEYLLGSNIKKESNWDLENGYDSSNKSYPLRATGNGFKSGLKTYLSMYKDDNDPMCRFNENGFKVILHAPNEIPMVNEDFILISNQERSMISITPKVIETSAEIKKYDISRRQCFFQDERYLEHFKIYTKSNCKLECLTNSTLRECGCVGFYMPRNKTTPVCGAIMKECMYKAELGLLDTRTQDDEITCNCLPTCISITYLYETSQATYDMKLKARLGVRTTDSGKLEIFRAPIEEASILNIYFKESEFVSWIRLEMYGITDFLANIGGFLGLFMGISVLSVTEIIYFFTFRLFTHQNSSESQN